MQSAHLLRSLQDPDAFQGSQIFSNKFQWYRSVDCRHSVADLLLGAMPINKIEHLIRVLLAGSAVSRAVATVASSSRQTVNEAQLADRTAALFSMSMHGVIPLDLHAERKAIGSEPQLNRLSYL